VRGILTRGDRILDTGERAELLDVAGRRVMELAPGPNDVRRLAAGVYFVLYASGVGRGASSVVKVVLQR